MRDLALAAGAVLLAVTPAYAHAQLATDASYQPTLMIAPEDRTPLSPDRARRKAAIEGDSAARRALGWSDADAERMRRWGMFGYMSPVSLHVPDQFGSGVSVLHRYVWRVPGEVLFVERIYSQGTRTAYDLRLGEGNSAVAHTTSGQIAHVASFDSPHHHIEHNIIGRQVIQILQEHGHWWMRMMQEPSRTATVYLPSNRSASRMHEVSATQYADLRRAFEETRLAALRRSRESSGGGGISLLDVVNSVSRVYEDYSAHNDELDRIAQQGQARVAEIIAERQALANNNGGSSAVPQRPVTPPTPRPVSSRTQTAATVAGGPGAGATNPRTFYWICEARMQSNRRSLAGNGPRVAGYITRAFPAPFGGSILAQQDRIRGAWMSYVQQNYGLSEPAYTLGCWYDDTSAASAEAQQSGLGANETVETLTWSAE